MTVLPPIQHWLVSVLRLATGGDVVVEVAPDAPVAQAWSRVAESGGRSDDELAECVANHFRLPVADLDARDPTAVRLLPVDAARHLAILPLRYTDRELVVATSDPVNVKVEQAVRRLSARNVQMAIAPPVALARALETAYPPDEVRRHQPPSVPPGDDADGPLVLVVEDEPGTRMLLRTVLESKGFRVAEAPDGKDALEILGMRRVDLVTLDLQLIEMDGMEVLREMRKNPATAYTPVIVATATDDPDVEMEALAAGADDFIVKPVDPPRFLLRVQAVLRRYGASEVPTTTPF